MVPSLYNPRYPNHPNYDAFPEGFVFECPYHPGGPLSVTTHRGYLGALRATVHCIHNGCHFSAYDDGSISSVSQCPTARAEREGGMAGDLKLGMQIPFQFLIYRRKWTPNQVDSGGRVVIPADAEPVMERRPGAPLPPRKSPNALQSPVNTHVGVVHNKPTNDNQSSVPTNMEDRGSSCFGNSITWGNLSRPIRERNNWGMEGARIFSTPPNNVMSFVESLGGDNYGNIKGLTGNISPIPLPPRDKPPSRNFFDDVDSPTKFSSDDDYVNVPHPPEKTSLPLRWQGYRNLHYHDAAAVEGTPPGGYDSAPSPNILSPEMYPGTVHRTSQLRDVQNQSFFTDPVVPVIPGNPAFTLRLNAHRGEQSQSESCTEKSVSGAVNDDLSAESIANLVLRLKEIPERLNSLEKVNEATSKSLDAKDVKINHLEEAIERSKLREKDLEDIIATYEQIGRRRQFSSLT